MKLIFKTITIVFVILNILLLISSNTSILGYKTLKVISGSMQKEININDLVIIKKSNYKVGDIITIKSGNTSFTHRIVKINDKEVITKGDNNSPNDKPSKIENIIGKVVLIIPKTLYKIFRATTISFLIIMLIISIKKGE